MTRFLLATWEGGGVIPPQLGLARRLIARGHEVRVLADPAVEDAARAAGCAFSPWRTAPHRRSLAPEDDVIRDWEYKNLLKLFDRMLDAFLCGPADRFASDTLAVLEQHPADVVLADVMILGAQIAAESAKVPTAILVPNIYMRPAEGVPPIGPGFMPATGVLGRLRDAIFRFVSARLWRKGLVPLNRARAQLGLDPLEELFAQYDRAQRVLVMTSKSFDFVSPALPANVAYVGPVLDDPSWAGADWSPPWPEHNHDPIVLVGLSSTYMDQLPVLRGIVAALASLRVRALVTLGPALPADALASPAPHVAVVRAAPHAAVLRVAKAAITHCGHGTTMRALAAGVPLVCLPMGRDQNDTAARVVSSGAGVRLKPTASPAAIGRALEAVLGDARYAQAAARLRDAIRREAEEVSPESILEALAPRGARPDAASARVPSVDSDS